MSEGELLQIEKARRLDIDEQIYYDIIRQKTATLIAACCACGATSVTDDAVVIDRAKKFGEAVGMAFQIKDDLLDLNSNSKELGKPVHQDLSNETPNFVNYYGEEKSIQKMNDSLEKSIESLNIFGNHAKNLVLLADYIVKRSH